VYAEYGACAYIGFAAAAAIFWLQRRDALRTNRRALALPFMAWARSS